VAKQGFNTPFGSGTLRDICLWMLDLSRQGLQRRDYRNQRGQDESCYLKPLEEAAYAGRTFAEELLHRFEHEWRGDIDVAVRTMCEEALM
jgi:glutamate--cysteine ligase